MFSSMDNSSLTKKKHTAPEPEPCKRCIENDKKKIDLQKRRAMEKKKEGQYMNLNMEEIERQLKMLNTDPHDCDDFRNDFRQ